MKKFLKSFVFAAKGIKSVISSETFILKLMIVKNDSTFSVEDRKRFGLIENEILPVVLKK